MSALEHEVHPPGSPGHAGKLAGVKGLMGKKVLGVPVLVLVIIAAALGFYLYRKNAAATATATDATGAADLSSSTADPGGVSGLDSSGGGYGGGLSGDASSGAGGMTSPDSTDLSSSIQALGDAVAGIQFPSGNPQGQNVPDPTSQIDPQVIAAATPNKTAKAAPKKPPSRGGHAIPVKVHPVVAARPKPKPAATHPAHPKAASGKTNRPATPAQPHSTPHHAPAAPAKKKPAPRPSGRAHR